MSDASQQEVFASDCPCLKLKCSRWGNCVECVRVHRRSQSHLPECMQDMLREHVAVLAAKVELRVSDRRPAASQEEARKRGLKVY